MEASDLGSVPLFAELSDTDIAGVAGVMKLEDHPRGAVLAEEGDLPSKFYVLLDGNVTVHRDGKHLNDLGPGDFFGEVGVLSMEARNASVIATTPVRVAAAMGWDLRNLLDGHPPLREALIGAAAERARQG
ncbi:MAG TPA: cyclic nucleotide-binding domain-containing protein [Acidimicrobiia bacterium]|nr:cyclic nucleotide-binding domain-containing protein [Acidimicrobiia bacterium]